MDTRHVVWLKLHAKSCRVTNMNECSYQYVFIKVVKMIPGPTVKVFTIPSRTRWKTRTSCFIVSYCIFVGEVIKGYIIYV